VHDTRRQHGLGDHTPKRDPKTAGIEYRLGKDLLQAIGAGEARRARDHLQCPPLNERVGWQDSGLVRNPYGDVIASFQEKSQVPTQQHAAGTTLATHAERDWGCDVPEPDTELRACCPGRERLNQTDQRYEQILRKERKRSLGEHA
jgi:hypothetical protein